MRDTPEGIIEELRRAAEGNAADLEMPGVTAEGMMEWEAADLLEEWLRALEAIGGGCDDPAKVARDLLDPIVRHGWGQSGITGSA